MNYYQTPTTATVGGTQNICGALVSGALGGNAPSVGQGAWSVKTKPSGSNVSFSDGGSGSSTATADVYGSYVFTWTISNGTCTASTADVTVNYTKNAICAAYTGPYLVNTESTTTGGSAKFKVTFNISGLVGATCNDLSLLQPNSFNISTTPANAATITNINYSTGLVTADVFVQLSNNEYSRTIQFNLSTTNSSYMFGDCLDLPLVTVSTKAEGFVTGGGYMIPSNSSGTIGTGAIGYKNNFGFNVKYNKSGTNLQGNWNTIIRMKDAQGKMHTYQVKSSSPKSLVVGKISATSYRADITFTGANIQDQTTGQGYGATGIVNLTVYDNGEPGTGIDQILINVKYPGTTDFYLSTSTTNAIPVLTAGNIQIHTLGAKTARIAADQQVTEVQPFNLRALPNPSATSFNLQLTSSNKVDKMSIRVTDITGRTVQVLHDLAPNQTLSIGAGYRPGLYMVELVQGNERKQIKLVKL